VAGAAQGGALGLKQGAKEEAVPGQLKGADIPRGVESGEAQARGELVLAGALADPADGALIVFQAESPATAEAFARHDPYVKNGLVANWKVRAWTVVVGNELRAPYIEKRAAESA